MPSTLQNGLLLDRNRLHAPLELKHKPVIEEYRRLLAPGEYIYQLNYERRDLEAENRG